MASAIILAVDVNYVILLQYGAQEPGVAQYYIIAGWFPDLKKLIRGAMSAFLDGKGSPDYHWEKGH